MFDRDVPEFLEGLDAVFGLYGAAMTHTQKLLWVELLKPYNLRDVLSAMKAHMSDGKCGRYTPKPADIIDRIQGATVADGRPGVEEAWSIAVQAMDEAMSVVVSEEIMQAIGNCRQLIEAGDKTASRMAFKEIYTRLVAQARYDRKPVEWRLSLGSDPDQRAIAAERGVRDGRLSKIVADQYLLPQANAFALLENKARVAATEKDHVFARQMIDRLKEMLNKPSKLEIQAHEDRQRTKAAKDSANARIAEYQKKAGMGEM